MQHIIQHIIEQGYTSQGLQKKIGLDAMKNPRKSISGDTVAGVLDEPYSQPTPLSGVAVQARQST
jgi:hypothetical protein